VVGAILIGVLLELLRDTGNARGVFYVLLGAGLLVAFKLSRRLAIVAAGVVAFGFAAHAIADAIDHSWVGGTARTGASDWVIVPERLASWVISLMILRPNGLLGEKRVEIV
jgi:hypothetical protein